MPVSVVTLLVDRDEAERLTLASTEGKIQLALRNPLDPRRRRRPASSRRRCSAPRRRVAPMPRAPRPARPQPAAAPAPPPAPDLPTVEIIRGDKRAHEVVRQEQQMQRWSIATSDSASSPCWQHRAHLGAVADLPHR